MGEISIEPLGFVVIAVNNGREALANMKEVRPDLIITDLMMPVMDGYQMLRLVRQIPELKDTLLQLVCLLAIRMRVLKQELMPFCPSLYKLQSCSSCWRNTSI